MIKNEILAYLAGIIDADGYITIKRSTYNIRIIGDSKAPIYYERIGIKQVQDGAINIIRELFGGSYRIDKPSSKNGKMIFVIELRNKKANEFIKAIYPFLIIKKRQAEIAINLRKAIDMKKQGTRKIIHKDRWGNETIYHKKCLSDEQIQYREKLFQQIKSFNDTRNHPYFKFKPVII